MDLGSEVGTELLNRIDKIRTRQGKSSQPQLSYEARTCIAHNVEEPRSFIGSVPMASSALTVEYILLHKGKGATCVPTIFCGIIQCACYRSGGDSCWRLCNS